MNRRTLLATTGLAIAPSIAGCLGDSSGNDEGGFGRSVSVTEIDHPDEGPVEFEMNVVDGTVTENETATIEATTENTGGSEFHVSPPYYKGASADASEPGIFLYSLGAPDSPPADYAPDCVDDTSPTQEYNDWTDEGLPHRELEPGGTVTDEFIVVTIRRSRAVSRPASIVSSRRQRCSMTNTIRSKTSISGGRLPSSSRTSRTRGRDPRRKEAVTVPLTTTLFA
jgi:hypothetical protein